MARLFMPSPGMPKRTQEQLIAMKQTIIERCLARQLRWTEAAQLLQMHPKALSRLKRQYLAHGVVALSGQKPGPKPNTPPPNKTPTDIAQLVMLLAQCHRDLGPVPLADQLQNQYGVTLHPTTIWRILKRQKIRYTAEYKRWKHDPKLYCLDQPGEELQLDACYPFGRQRQVVSFDAIDDCSRTIYGKCYDRETTDNAIRFVTELVGRVPFRIQRLRVDNRYGQKFTLYCETMLNIQVITNDPYTPEQNGKIERFHKTLKREFFWKHCAFSDSIDLLNYKYWQWIQYYNYQRKHGGYGMHRLTPAQKLASTWHWSLAQQLISYPQKVTGTLQQYISCQFVKNLLALAMPLGV